MDVNDVPQEGNRTLGSHRKAMYAKDADGKMVIVTSRGSEVDETVTMQAVDRMNALARRWNTGCMRSAWMSRCCRKSAASGNGASAATSSRNVSHSYRHAS
jgi:hypothetical protein